MAIHIGPVSTHLSTDYHPPGIVGDDWCHMVSDDSLLALEAFLTLNILTIAALNTSIRTPLLGSQVTYVALNSTQRTAAIAAGASAVPSDGKCYARAFDLPTGTWE